MEEKLGYRVHCGQKAEGKALLDYGGCCGEVDGDTGWIFDQL